MKRLLESVNNKLENSILRIPLKVFILLFIIPSVFLGIWIFPFLAMDHLRIISLWYDTFFLLLSMSAISTIIITVIVIKRIFRQRAIDGFSAGLFATLFIYDLAFFLSANYYWMFVER